MSGRRITLGNLMRMTTFSVGGVGMLVMGLSGSATAQPTVQWHRLAPATVPTRGVFGPIVCPPGRDQVIMFGWIFADGAYRNEMWVYTGGNWVQQGPRTDTPGRKGLAMDYDPVRDRLVLWGGYTRLGAVIRYPQETWEYVAGEWRMVPTSNAPTGRHDHGMVYDTARDRIVMFGGRGAGGEDNDETWEFDGANWTRIDTSSATPLARFAHGMCYDSARNVVVMHGGQHRTVTGGIANTVPLSDTWEYEAGGWRLAFSGAPAPADNVDLAYDEETGRVVATNIDTWEYDGTTWRILNTADLAPGGSLVYNNNTGLVTLYGGSTGNELWELIISGATTTPTPTPTPVVTATPTPIPSNLLEPLAILDGEHWAPVTFPGVFTEPTLAASASLVLDTSGSNTFGFLETRSLVGPLDDGRYRLVTTVTPSGAPGDGETYPEIRLRVSTGNSLVNFLRADASTGADPGERQLVSYFATNGGPDSFRVAVDILRFIDNQTGGFTVTEFSVEPLAGNGAALPPPLSGSTVATLATTLGNWRPVDIPSAFSTPTFQAQEDGLLLSTTAGNTFGFWRTDESIGPLEAGTYLLVATVSPEGSLEEGQAFPELRLRVSSEDSLVNHVRADAATGADPAARSLEMLFDAEQGARFGVALDILRFLDNQRGGYVLNSVSVHRME